MPTNPFLKKLGYSQTDRLVIIHTDDIGMRHASNPQIDMGIHATLTAEWESYRWGTIATREQTAGLLDADGDFHQWHQAVYEHAMPVG